LEDFLVNEDAIVKEIRKLKVSVWALFAGVIILSAVIAAPKLYPDVANTVEPEVAASAPATSAEASKDDDIEDFYDLPVAQQIEKASAIVITKYQKEGEYLTSTVSEILKLSPGTEFYYKVGDKLEYGVRSLKPDPEMGEISYGEGEIVFFVGSPAMMKYSTSYEGERCSGLGDIPIEMLKEMIRKQVEKEAGSPNNSLKVDVEDGPVRNPGNNRHAP